ncbi:hypothetical protein HYT53_06000 [Candidatus Woesearchaeota archaeon]|nr:hypothetical protein [Candidatus Woesearchaeota archaeon]
MKKRGDTTAFWFFVETIVAIVIVFMIVDVSVARAEGKIYEKLNIAKDIAMQINTLSGISGDAYIVNKNLHGYSLHFFDNRIEVFENSFEQSKGIYYFVKIGDTKLDLRLDKPKQVVVAKINNEIAVSEDIPSAIK